MNTSTLDNYVNELLHIDDIDKNKLINLNGGNKAKTFRLSCEGALSNFSHVMEIIKNRIGKPGNTVMRFSAENQNDEQILGQNVNYVDWVNLEGLRDVSGLKKFIESVYKELSLKGNNPIFLSVGAIDYKVSKKSGESVEVKSPLILFPIKLIRSENGNTPVYIEFINDDIYVNPCLIAKLKRAYGDKIVEDFPHPNGAGRSLDEEISIDFLSNYNAYFNAVATYVEKQTSNAISENTLFNFDKNAVYIAEYNHDEICVYYDIKRNREKINSHKLVNRIFNKNKEVENFPTSAKQINTVLPVDSAQERIIRRVVNGESLIIKGPPGTGKTVTITNMIASLLAENKKILLSSTKLAAMNEVYAKLPKELRKFTMLLDSETESQTVKINPVDVRKDLISLLNDKKSYKPDVNASGNLNVAIKEKSTAIRNLNAYVKSAHIEKDILGGSYYDALNVIAECENEPILFTDSSFAYAVNLTDYQDLLSKVKNAVNYFNKVCDGNEYYKNPFVPLNGSVQGVNFEKALSLNETINESVKKVKDNLVEIFDETETLNALKLLTLYAISGIKGNEEEVNKVLASENAENLSLIEKVLKEYLVADFAKTDIVIKGEIDESVANKIKCFAVVDGELTLSDFNLIIQNEKAHAISVDENKVKSLINHVLDVEKTKTLIKEKEEEFYSIFIKDLSKETIKTLNDAVSIYAKYDENAVKPKLFDFKGKKYYNLLKTFGYGEEVSFVEVVKAVAIYGEILNLQEEVINKQTRISSLFKIKFTTDEIDAVFTIVKRALTLGVKVTDYLKNLLKVKADVVSLIENVECNYNYKLSEMFNAYAKKVKLNELKNAENKIMEVEDSETLNFALKVVAYKNLKEIGVENVYEFASNIYEKGKVLNANVLKVYEYLRKFKSKCYETYYTNSLQVTLLDLEIFINKSTDRNSLSAVTEYLNIVKGKNVLPISAFFNKFEIGERKDADIVKTFKKSVYYLAVKEKLKKAEFTRNGLGDKLNRSLEAFSNAEKTISETTVKIIENQCFSRIDTDNHGYAFLNAERGGETLRKLFKTHAHEILKLKKCFILSPPTASVLMKNDEFATFDTVIVDEASQLEPKDILPVLFRAKQVILVGDEWQMPPIKHFKTKSEIVSVNDDGEYEILNPDTSVLSLALNNCAFPVEQLICHYRSNTESLIAFSQKKFYDYMRTFPASEPKTDDVGFKDVYVDSAVVKNGVNQAEAKKVVEELSLHFDKYFNEETGVLSKSVGVVAFGKEQLDYVTGLVDKNEKLSSKIKTALSNFNDLPEKLVFFKTIETVQGQETESLILTLTYGRDADGKIVQRFGELNRGADESKLGQCIFNVAVTRAKSSVTLIHSVKATDIDNENVKYLREYIEIVEKFAKDGKAQFIGDKVDEVGGFIKAVAEYIVSLGVEKDRIVLNSGVTEGSIKIPLVILSKDYKKAELGLWVEGLVTADKNYLDYNSRYVNSLKQRGWNIERVYSHDWFDNNKYEKENIKNVVNKYVNV